MNLKKFSGYKVKKNLPTLSKTDFFKRLESLGYSMNSFAELVNMSYGSLNNWDTVPKWAEVLLEKMENEYDIKSVKNGIKSFYKIFDDKNHICS